MTEFFRHTYPISFEVVERFSDLLKKISIYIGNSGGQYDLKEGSDYFEQHFSPDGSWDPAETIEQKRKHSTLYPAVIWEFLQWQEALEESDQRKYILYIKGKTNKTMSDFRLRLLGSHYTAVLDEATQLYAYTIDLKSLKEDEKLMKKLKDFSIRAKRLNYTTTNVPPKPGRVASIVMTLDDL